jgi:hypothetical protein
VDGYGDLGFVPRSVVTVNYNCGGSEARFYDLYRANSTWNTNFRQQRLDAVPSNAYADAHHDKR